MYRYTYYKQRSHAPFAKLCVRVCVCEREREREREKESMICDI